MNSTKLIQHQTIYWRVQKGEVGLYKGTSETRAGDKKWEGRFFLIGLPWFQIRFEKHWRTTSERHEQY